MSIIPALTRLFIASGIDYGIWHRSISRARFIYVYLTVSRNSDEKTQQIPVLLAQEAVNF